MSSKCLFVLFILFSSLFADDFIVKEIDFTGNKSFSKEILIKQLKTKTNMPFENDLIQEDVVRLNQFYRTNHFDFTKIPFPEKIPIDHQNVRLVFHIEEQKLFEIKSVVFKNSRYFSSNKLNELIDRKRYKIDSIEQIKIDVLDLYLSRAYLFTQIRLDSLSISNDSLRAYFFIDEGKQCFFNTSLFKGNQVSKSESLLKISKLKKSQLVTYQSIKDAETLLKEKEYIQHCSITPVNHETLLFDIKEGKMSRLEGIFGYNNQNKNSLTGFVKLDFLNLFGYDRHFNFSWQSLQNKQKFIKMFYQDPGFQYFPLNFNFSFSRREVDSTYIQINFQSEVFKTVQNNSFGIIFGMSDINPGDRKLNTINKSKQRNVGAFWIYKTFDYPKNPTKGTMLSYKTIISFIEKKEEQDNLNIKRNSNEFQFQAVIPIKRNIVWYNSLSCKLMQNKSLAFYDLYSIGGPYNLRGYSDDFFMGNNLAYLNSELRLLTSKDSRFFLFFDYGIIQDQREGINLLIDDAISYGIGLRYPTRLGIVMMDYALHYYEQKFLHPMDAYIHLGIQTNF